MSTPVIRPYQLGDQPRIEWLYSRTPPWGRTYPRPLPIPDDIKRITELFEYVLSRSSRTAPARLWSA